MVACFPRRAGIPQPLIFLGPGQAIERELRVPLPFAEASPHFTDLRLREYETAEVAGMVFAIGYFAADTPGLYAAPAAYAPEYHVLSATVAPVVAGLAWQTLPVKKLEILKRTDAFPRELKSHSIATGRSERSGCFRCSLTRPGICRGGR